MHSLVPFLTAMGRSRFRLSVESMEVSSGCVCKSGSDLTVISFPGFESDFWTCFGYGMTFSLEYTLGNCGKLRVTLAGTGNDTGSVVELGDLGSSSPWVEHEEGQEVQRIHKDYLPSLKSPP